MGRKMHCPWRARSIYENRSMLDFRYRSRPKSEAIQISEWARTNGQWERLKAPREILESFGHHQLSKRTRFPINSNSSIPTSIESICVRKVNWIQCWIEHPLNFTWIPSEHLSLYKLNQFFSYNVHIPALFKWHPHWYLLHINRMAIRCLLSVR